MVKRERDFHRWRDCALAATALLLAGLAALHGLAFMPSFNTAPPVAVRENPDAPGLREPAAREPGATAAAVRVVLAVVDGLRDDAATSLGLEARPDAASARCTLQADWPSYSRASYATLGTGAPPALTGVHNNRHRGPVLLDSVFARARSAGLELVAVTDGVAWWGELFPAVWSRHLAAASSFAPGVDALFAAGSPDLALVHTVVVDKVGHELGATDDAYLEAVRTTGSWLQRLRSAMDPSRDVLLVTSDHGHLDRGGHGGQEADVLRVPLLAFGRGIAAGVAPGVCSGGRTADVAPTVAALLGVAPPRHAVGRALTEILDLPGPVLAAIAAEETRNHEALAAALGAEGGDLAAVVSGLWRRPAAGPVLASLALWCVLATLLVLFAASPRDTTPLGLPAAIAAAAAYPAAFTVANALVEPTLSFSAVWNRKPWLGTIALMMIGALALTMFVRWRLRRGASPRSIRVHDATAIAAAVLPWFLAAGIHGAIWGGPVLGHPQAAFALILSDIVAFGGCLTFGAAAITLRRSPPAGR